MFLGFDAERPVGEGHAFDFWPACDSHSRLTTSADHQVYLTNKEQALMRLSSELASEVHDGLFAAF